MPRPVINATWIVDSDSKSSVAAKRLLAAWHINAIALRGIPILFIVATLFMCGALVSGAIVCYVLMPALFVLALMGRVALAACSRPSSTFEAGSCEDDGIGARVSVMAFVKESESAPMRVDRGVLAVIDGAVVFVGTSGSLTIDCERANLRFGPAHRTNVGYDVCAEFEDRSFARFKILGDRDSRLRTEALFHTLRAATAFRKR